MLIQCTHSHMNKYTHVYMEVHRHIHTYTHAGRHPSIHPSIHPPIHMYVCTYLPTNLFTYIHTYMHTYTKRNIYVFVCVRVWNILKMWNNVLTSLNIQYTPVTTRCSGSTGPYHDITDLCNTFSTVGSYSIITHPSHVQDRVQDVSLKYMCFEPNVC